MNRIKHFAIICMDADRMKEFYCRFFKLEDFRHHPGDASIYLSDGYLNINLLRKRPEMAEENQEHGLHHVGFQIDSIEETRRRLKEFDPSIKVEERPKDGRYAEYRIKDPEGIPIDLSEKGYGVDGEKRIPGVRHIATASKDTERKLRFYRDVLGMREVRRIPESGAIFVADGFINLALLKWPTTEPRMGFNHFGFLTRNPRKLMNEIAESYPTRRDQRPPERPYAEYRIWDPEGTAIDLSETKGWEVDVGKSDRIE